LNGKKPIELMIYPRKEGGTAEGFLYMDDGKTLQYSHMVRF